jgi:hypothetical protein
VRAKLGGQRHDLSSGSVVCLQRGLELATARGGLRKALGELVRVLDLLLCTDLLVL